MSFQPHWRPQRFHWFLHRYHCRHCISLSLGHKTPSPLPLRESPKPTAGHPKKETEFHTTSETEIETKIGPSQGASFSTSQTPVTSSLSPVLALPSSLSLMSPHSLLLIFLFLSLNAPVFLSELSLSLSLFLTVNCNTFLYFYIAEVSVNQLLPLERQKETIGRKKDPQRKRDTEKMKGAGTKRETNSDRRDNEVKRIISQDTDQDIYLKEASMTTLLPPSHLVTHQDL